MIHVSLMAFLTPFWSYSDANIWQRFFFNDKIYSHCILPFVLVKTEAWWFFKNLIKLLNIPDRDGRNNDKSRIIITSRNRMVKIFSHSFDGYIFWKGYYRLGFHITFVAQNLNPLNKCSSIQCMYYNLTLPSPCNIFCRLIMPQRMKKKRNMNMAYLKNTSLLVGLTHFRSLTILRVLPLSYIFFGCAMLSWFSSRLTIFFIVDK